MLAIGFDLVKNTRLEQLLAIETLENKIFKLLSIQERDGTAILLNYGIDLGSYHIDTNDYLHIEVNSYDEVDFSGKWIEGVSDDFCSVKGSMSFILINFKSYKDYYKLNNSHSGSWLQNYQDSVDQFTSKGVDYVRSFAEQKDDHAQTKLNAKKNYVTLLT